MRGGKDNLSLVSKGYEKLVNQVLKITFCFEKRL